MVTPWIKPEDTAFPQSDYAGMAVDYATFVLYKLTGEKYPGVSRTIETYIHESYRPYYQDPTAREAVGAAIGVPTNLQYPQRLYLRGTPVHEVYNVTVGGETLAPSEYMLFNKKFLRMSNGDMWGYGCNEQGVTVEYSYGMMPPKAGILAASTLANELLILMGEGNDGSRCRIPERVRSVSREGISFDMIDPQEFMDEGRTGIWEIDLFIRTANPAKAKKQPRLLSSNNARRYRS